MINNQNFRCLSVVMPVYNEVRHLKQILSRVCAVPIKKEIVLVDDCSKDGTRDLLRAHQDGTQPLCKEDENNSIKIFFQEKNQGKGAALRRGIRETTGDIVVMQDADLEYNPAEYDRLIEPILSGEADVVVGSRYLGERRRVQNFFAKRRGGAGYAIRADAIADIRQANATAFTAKYIAPCWPAHPTQNSRAHQLLHDGFEITCW